MNTKVGRKPDRYQEHNRALEDVIRRAIGDTKHLKMHLDRWLQKGADPNSPPLLGKKSSIGKPFLHTDLLRKLIREKHVTL